MVSESIYLDRNVVAEDSVNINDDDGLSIVLDSLVT